MKVVFFTEAGTKRGMGHLIRCQTIANEFIKNGKSVDFFLDSNINFDYLYKNINYFHWEDFNLTNIYDVIFIDSYEADILIYESISRNSKLAIFIDDYSRLEYPKGIIINFALNAKDIFLHKLHKQNTYFLGIDYIPIRDIFLKNKNIKKENAIFIMMGGFDTKNISEKIIKSIENINIKKIIVVNKEDIKNKLQKYENIEILFKPDEELLVKKMSKCSFAISTASMTAYELSFLNIPTIILTVSSNQVFGALEFIKNGIAFSYIKLTCKNWKEILRYEMNDLIKKNYSLHGKIDGLGANRIFSYVKNKVP